MAIYDKVPPGGTFRAPLAADWSANRDQVYLAELNLSGQIQRGTGTGGTNTQPVGVIVVRGIQQPYYPGQTPTYRLPKAGEIVDVMKRGEIVEITTTDITGAAAGQPVYYTTATGALTNVATGGVKIGHMVDATRFVVNFPG